MDWHNAKWIGAGKDTDFLLLFRKEFILGSKPLSADLFVCGLGFYDYSVNGVTPDQPYFKPDISDYMPRKDPRYAGKKDYFAYYDHFDVTSDLVAGTNILSFRVAPGYFHVTDKLELPFWDFGRQRLIFLLRVKTARGTDYIVSGPDTLVAVSSSSSRLFLGDHLDFTETDPAFTEPKVFSENIALRENDGPYDWGSEIFLGKYLCNEPRHVIVDFGKNHTGGIFMDASGRRGTKLFVRYAEFMNPDGTLNFLSSAYDAYDEKTYEKDVKNKKNPAKHSQIQENTYVLSGGTDHISVQFSYRCYRYIEILSEEDVKMSEIKSLFIHSDVSQILRFDCNEPIYNELFSKYVQTQLCNLHSGFSSDCPTREKMPYTGDASFVVDSLLTCFDSEKMLSHWLDIIVASQHPDGFVPYTSPDFGCGGGFFWSYAIVRIPETLFRHTGNKEYLERALPAITRFIGYLTSVSDENHLVRKDAREWLLPDWLAPDIMQVDSSYFNSLCYYLTVREYIRISGLLGREAGDMYPDLLLKIKDSINAKYFHPESGTYSGDRQGETLAASFFGIVPEGYEDKVQEAIVRHYSEKTNRHLDTGIVLTPALFQWMSDHGFCDLAESMLLQKDYPSFAYLLSGETTLPEHWSKKWIPFSFSEGGKTADAEMEGTDVSHCHPMYGGVVAWLVRTAGGFELLPGKEAAICLPLLSKITSVNIECRGIRYHYRNPGKATLHIDVPENYNINIKLDSSKIYTLKTDCFEKRISEGQTILRPGKYVIQEN